MPKLKEAIPKPRSIFIKVRCPDCGHENMVFDRASRNVSCSVCGAVIAEATGGKVLLRGEVVERLG
ncbi:MAG: 30S ribosomal protein S27e [Candidatus Hecatellaceae archaeon]|nr:MAG: 30S ribosomal protein S27e [Candidatus Hecatellales archaeon]